MRPLRTLLGVVLVWTIVSGTSWAQAVAGSQISGVVRDSSGAVLPGVEVTAKQTDTGLSRTVFTGADGAYIIPNLPVGPYMLTEWVRGSHLTFVKNPKYWGPGEPFLDRIIVKIMPDASARMLALQAGEVDYIDQYYFPISALNVLRNDPRFSLKEVSYPSTDIIILNTKKKPLDNPKVRQALLTAIDRQFILKNVFLGSGQVGKSAFDTRLGWSYNPNVDFDKLYPYSAERAKQLLDEAGLKPGPDGTRFTLRLSFDTARGEYTSWAQALQRFWQAAGIKVVLEGAERPVVLKRVYTDYDFDATLQNYSTAGDPAIGVARAYHSESIKQGTTFNNASGYSNPEVDALFDKGRDAPNQEARKEAQRNLENVAQAIPPRENLPERMTEYRGFRLTPEQAEEIPYPPVDREGTLQPFVAQLLELKDKGRARVLTDTPARNFYVAVLESAYAALRAAESDLHLDALDPVEGIRELALFNWRYHVAHPELISLVRTENLHKAHHLRRSRRLSGSADLHGQCDAASSDLSRTIDAGLRARSF